MDLIGELPMRSRNYGDDVYLEDNGEFEVYQDQKTHQLPQTPTPPIFNWTPPMRKRLRSKNVVHARRVLLAFGREACAALRSATTPLPVSTQAKSDKKLSSTQSELIGTMVLPSPISGVCLGGGEVSFDASLPACLIYSFQPTESITNENAADDGIDTVMCFCLQDTPPPNRFQWVETLLLERIKTHEVLLFGTVPSSSYTCHDLNAPSFGAVTIQHDSYASSTHPPLLRRMRTSAVGSSLSFSAVASPSSRSPVTEYKVCPMLAPPNMSDSLMAAVITHCEVYGIAAQAFFSLVHPEYDVETVSAFYDVFKAIRTQSKVEKNTALSSLYLPKGKKAQALYRQWLAQCAIAPAVLMENGEIDEVDDDAIGEKSKYLRSNAQARMIAMAEPSRDHAAYM